MKKNIVILGSTGSIGVSTLDVVARHREQFQVVGLVAGKNISRLATQIRQFSPAVVVLQEEEDIPQLRKKLNGSWKGEIRAGEAAACCIAQAEGIDLVVSAMVGVSGLRPTYAALKKGKRVALANKESLVAAGPVMMAAAYANSPSPPTNDLTPLLSPLNLRGESKGGYIIGGQGGSYEGTLLSPLIIPVDSEHSAIFQVLQGQERKSLRKITLTASGGPFRTCSEEQLKKVTIAQALQHPNWAMGKKITIDSATMMNKGLEMIEARWLFGLTPAEIEVRVHPQSIIHSLVEFQDGSWLAQLGLPDMRTPIAYALAYPDRMESGVPPMELTQISPLTFEKPDEVRFPSIRLAREALSGSESAPCVLNAANEVAVAAFLQEKIPFVGIAALVEKTLQKHIPKSLRSIDEVLELDAWARNQAQKEIAC